jgi:hypothetical protein
MSLFNEPVWFSGRPGEARVCGGCHENRTSTTNVTPGLLDTFASGAAELFGTTPRAQRVKTAPASATEVVGVAWDKQVQPIFDAKCISCHDGTPGPANPSYTIVDATTGAVVLTWTFNLKGDPLPASFAVAAGGGAFSSSYFTMAGPDMEALQRGNLMAKGLKVYLNPEDARGSLAIQKLNPTQLFPVPSSATRAFPGTMPHLIEQGRADLTPQDFYTLILAADMGVNYYARENNPGLNIY